MVEVPASAAIFRVDSASAPCSANSLAATSTNVARISGSSFRGDIRPVLHNDVIRPIALLRVAGRRGDPPDEPPARRPAGSEGPSLPGVYAYGCRKLPLSGCIACAERVSVVSQVAVLVLKQLRVVLILLASSALESYGGSPWKCVRVVKIGTSS
ncbi:hypothetical protein GCM10027184_76730 [Saccharothrix stipae]